MSFIKLIEIKTLLKNNKSPFISVFVSLTSEKKFFEKEYLSLNKEINRDLRKYHLPAIELTIPNLKKLAITGHQTLAIYYHDGVTTYVPISIKMESRYIIANSFHIKPLVASLNENKHTLLIHFNDKGVNLYKVGLHNDVLIDNYIPPVHPIYKNWPDQLNQNDLKNFINYICKEVSSNSNEDTVEIVLSGVENTCFEKLRFWSEIQLPTSIIKTKDSFFINYPTNTINILKNNIKENITKTYIQKINSFDNVEKIELEDLTSLIQSKEIKHICVSLEDVYFNPPQKDSFVSSLIFSNDDLLDDIIELAMEKGIQVSVVPKKYLPRGKIFLAS